MNSTDTITPAEKSAISDALTQPGLRKDQRESTSFGYRTSTTYVWEVMLNDGITVKVSYRNLYSAAFDSLGSYRASVLHTDENSHSVGGYVHSTKSVPALKRGISKLVRETRETLAIRKKAKPALA